MTEAHLDPISRPNSTLGRLPALAQLHFVNASLEKNPHPRECYSRQFSVTPDRQTPESQRTPFMPWPDPDPIEELKEAKAWAAEEAKRLEQFYAGRVLLRKEEPEKYGIFGEDPEYWDSQTSHWKAEYEKLADEYDWRKQLEAERNANEGYAEALLLSPLQMASLPPSDEILQATALKTENQKPNVRLPEQPFAKSRVEPSEKRPHPQQPTPDPSTDSITKGTKSQKHSCVGLGRREEDERSFDQTRLRKEQWTEDADLTPTHKSDPVVKTAREPRKRDWKASKVRKKGASKRKKLPSSKSQAPRLLPWDLRSRHVIS
ncbi:MAG: hypothetical protein ASARMPREDX12_005542 [Alectoria sarmentosa]|nr:MAG: hypothetical protein ASARMPREDX12_005542 [Alectoria sarmentosa]